MGKNIRQRIAQLLLEGYSIRWVARHLKLNPSTVSRIATSLIQGGYLINTAPRGLHADFVRGPNGHDQLLHTCNSASKIKTDPPDGVGQEIENLEIIGGSPTEGFIPMRLHCLGHRFEVIEGPSKTVPWTQTTDCSGVPNHVLELPMGPEDNRLIKIVYREGREAQSIDVWTPEVIVTNPTALAAFPNWATERAQRIANWLMRKFGFKLGIMEMCQDFEFAAVLPKEVAEAAKALGLKSPDLWMDTSRGRGEMETADQVKAVQLMTLPARMSALEEHLPAMERSLAILAEGQIKLAHSMESLVETLQKLLGKKGPEPPQTDPGRMFG